MYPRPVCRRPHPYLNAGPPTWSPALETGRSPAELLSNWRSTKRRVKRAEKNQSGNTHTKLRKPEKCCTPSKAVIAGQPGRGSGQIRPIDLGHLEAGIPQPHSCRSALCNVDQFEGMTASWRGTCLDVWGPAVGHKGWWCGGRIGGIDHYQVVNIWVRHLVYAVGIPSPSRAASPAMLSQTLRDVSQRPASSSHLWGPLGCWSGGPSSKVDWLVKPQSDKTAWHRVEGWWKK